MRDYFRIDGEITRTDEADWNADALRDELAEFLRVRGFEFDGFTNTGADDDRQDEYVRVMLQENATKAEEAARQWVKWQADHQGVWVSR